jgi:hypothetical protein
MARGTRERPFKPSNNRGVLMTDDPVGAVVASAGKALETLADAGAEGVAAWELDVDAPQVTVDDDAALATQLAGGVLAFLATALAVVLLFVLEDLLVHNWPHQHAATIVLAGGVVVLALLVATAAWRSLAYSGERVRVKLRRTAPAPATTLPAADLAAQLAAVAAVAAGAAPAPAAVAVPPVAGQAAGPAGAAATTPTPPKSPVAKEPVIVATGLFAAGTLAIGFAANLGAGEVAAIAAGSSALIGLLVRQQVTPVAAPKDAKNTPLTPPEASLR